MNKNPQRRWPLGRLGAVRPLAVSMIGLGLGLVLSGCGGGSEGADAVDDVSGTDLVEAVEKEDCKSITWYASSDAELVERISDSFQDEYGIEVDWVEAGSADVVSRLTTEARAGGSAADVVTTPVEALAPLVDMDLFQPYRSALVDDIDSTIVDSLEGLTDYANPVQLGAWGIVYNTDAISAGEAPTSYEDLLDPRWSGVMAAADPRYGVSYAAVIDFIVDTYGWEFFDEIGPDLRLARGAGDTQALLVTGEKEVLTYAGFTVAERAITEEGAPIAMVVPEEGMLVYSSASSIVKTSDCPYAARLLIDYSMDEEAQSWIPDYGYYAAREGIPSPDGAPNLETTNWLPTDWKDVADADSYEAIVERFEQALG